MRLTAANYTLSIKILCFVSLFSCLLTGSTDSVVVEVVAFSPSRTHHVHNIRIQNYNRKRVHYAAIANDDDADVVVNGIVSTKQSKNEDSSTYDFTKEELADISKLSSDLDKLKNIRPAEPSSDFSAPTDPADPNPNKLIIVIHINQL